MMDSSLNLAQLSESFRNKRISLGYTVDFVSNIAKISDRTYVKIENDAYGVKISTLKKVAEALGFSLEEEVVFHLAENKSN